MGKENRKHNFMRYLALMLRLPVVQARMALTPLMAIVTVLSIENAHTLLNTRYTVPERTLTRGMVGGNCGQNWLDWRKIAWLDSLGPVGLWYGPAYLLHLLRLYIS